MEVLQKSVFSVWANGLRNKRVCYVEGKLYGFAPEPVQKKNV